MTKDYVRCAISRCGWIGRWREVPFAPNPFVTDETLYACPSCKTIGNFYDCCDEPECFEPASCGTPTQNGYRRTCLKHMPKEGDLEAL